MILGPFVFCYLAEFNTYENRPETVGKSMFICVFAGVISIGNALLLGCFYLHDNCNTVQDLVSSYQFIQFKHKVIILQLQNENINAKMFLFYFKDEVGREPCIEQQA